VPARTARWVPQAVYLDIGRTSLNLSRLLGVDTHVRTTLANDWLLLPRKSLTHNNTPGPALLEIASSSLGEGDITIACIMTAAQTHGMKQEDSRFPFVLATSRRIRGYNWLIIKHYMEAGRLTRYIMKSSTIENRIRT
jgi:hypothetical protein